MKTIYLLRHAKSSWTDLAAEDFERPLNERGRCNAEQIGHYLSQNDIRPDLILCSAAARAQETMNHLRPFLPENQSVQIEDSLYLAAAATILKYIEKVSEAHNSVMVIAHNPGLHELSLNLAGRENIGNSPILNQIMQKYPTGALATVKSMATTWQDLAKNDTKIEDFVCPKDLPSLHS